jgi:hypothetical protein
VPGAGIEPARREAGDFKSPVSTDSTIEASIFDAIINILAKWICQIFLKLFSKKFHFQKTLTKHLLKSFKIYNT